MKNSFNKVKNFFIKKIEDWGFIKKSAKKWSIKPRGAIYVYLSIIALVIGVALFGYVIYLMAIWHSEVTKTGLSLITGSILFIILKILISIAVFVYAVLLPGSNIADLLARQPSYVDYLVENDQRRFAKNHHYYPE